MRHFIPTLALACTSLVQAEGNYDPFTSRDPHERAQAARMQDAIEKGNWKLAERFATTDALRRLFAQAKIAYGKTPTATEKK